MADEPKLSFEGQGLRLDTAADADVICQKLSEAPIKTLVLEGNTIGIEAAEAIGKALAKQPFLRQARFKDIFTSRGRTEIPIAINHLLTGISDSGTELTLLDLSDNAIGPIGAPSIFKFLATNSSKKIEKLYLNNCGLGPEGSSLISVPISELRLKEFICGRNRLENKGATFMFAAMREMNTLEILKMPQNGINVEGISMIMKALLKNLNTIRILDLSDNTLKVKGAEALEKVIKEAKNLEVLKLDDALLGNEGFSIICDAITQSKYAKNTLMEASFEGNELKGQKIIDLIDLTFSQCQGGFSLDLLDNEFTQEQLQRLQTLEEKFTLIIDDPEDMDEEYGDDENSDVHNGTGDGEDDDEQDGDDD
uniref:Ran GTPase-activating protein 1 n=1 Tax=Aceria tosichella TaxID=561515 RepID=A0A6G1S7U1_9ACAR